MPKKTVAVLTLGCKLNQADSESLARELAAAGCQVIDRPAAADAFVINTCSVTHVADRKSRHLARLARRLSPGAAVALTGCYVETAGSQVSDDLGVDLVLGNGDKSLLVDRLLASLPAALPAPPTPHRERAALRTRAFVAVQEGCNDVCAFCIVPRTRGRERSAAVEEVVASVEEREREGVLEVVLTGTQLGAYGRERGSFSGPAPLISALLAETAMPRLRLSSLQPQDVTPELLALWEDPRLCRHFHVALQSGSDAVLRRMRRRYTVDEFRRALTLIREHVPEAAVTTDVIAGFPGETDAEFEETLSICREAAFAALHVFPYSRRSGTAAARMARQVPEAVKRGRVERLLGLGAGLKAAFLARFQGRVVPVLWETCRRDGEDGISVWEGLTDNYIRVFVRSDIDLDNRVVPARLTGQRPDGFWGKLLAGETEPA
jgi:threonylcarbamoyladenosine tRNA methylthiotransferase MtaB